MTISPPAPSARITERRIPRPSAPVARPSVPRPPVSRPTGGWAVVTGASSGIGAEFARELGRRGRPVLMAGRSREGLDAVAADVATAETIVGDLTEADGLAGLERALAGREVDLLVANAGAGGLGVLSDIDVATIENTVAVNLVAVMRLCRAVLPGMIERGRGGIVLVSSSASAQAAPANPVYAATKAAVENFARSIRADAGPQGVRVTCVRPGYIRTAFHARHHEDLSHVPARKWRTPHDVVTATLRAQDEDRAFVAVPSPNVAARMYAAAARLRGN